MALFFSFSASQIAASQLSRRHWSLTSADVGGLTLADAWRELILSTRAQKAYGLAYPASHCPASPQSRVGCHPPRKTPVLIESVSLSILRHCATQATHCATALTRHPVTPRPPPRPTHTPLQPLYTQQTADPAGVDKLQLRAFLPDTHRIPPVRCVRDHMPNILCLALPQRI